MPCTRVDDDKRAAPHVDPDTRRRDDPHEHIVDRALKIPAVENKLSRILKHVRDDFFLMCLELVTALAHHIPEQDRALTGVDPIVERLANVGTSQSTEIRRLIGHTPPSRAGPTASASQPRGGGFASNRAKT